MKKSISVIVLSVALSALTAYGVVRAADANRTSPNTTTIVSDGSMYRTVNLNQTEYPDFTYAAESAVDAVVFVKVTIRNEQNYDIDPFLRYFFGFGNGAPREQQGSGSGVIIRPDGYIVTNNHVVSGATKIEVTLNNNKTYEAKIIGTDPATDVALIKVEAEAKKSDDIPVRHDVQALGESISLLSLADHAFFVDDYFCYPGCNVEKDVCTNYGIPHTMFRMEHICPDVVEMREAEEKGCCVPVTSGSIY
ncbi:MAG: trypsin-like peptidase domain-containing protein [Bacteroidales bacterium]|nr:trypsin-like peptidase domain-containing protein [Bacteroidales bacterium]